MLPNEIAFTSHTCAAVKTDRVWLAAVQENN
jgi:hypothetical protein